MSGTLKVGGKTIATHDTNTNVAKIQLGSTSDVVLTDSAGNNVLSESGGVVTLTADTAVIEGSSSGNLVRITQTGSGNALVVEDSTNPDSSPFVVNSSGNVGIGTSSPSVNLEVAGSSAQIFLNNTNATSNGSHDFSITALKSGIGFNNLNIGGYETRFKVGGSQTEAMRIDSSGNLLVGTQSPALASTSTLQGIAFNSDATTQMSRAGTILYLNRISTDGTILDFRKNGTSVGTVSTNANALPSDRNFKKDIYELEFGLDLVKKLKPKTYRYKINDDNSPFMIGFVAQDLEESLLQVGVNQNECWILQHNENVEDGNSAYQLDYSRLIPILAKAIQEQQALIESQQSQIDALTARIEALETPAE